MFNINGSTVCNNRWFIEVLDKKSEYLFSDGVIRNWFSAFDELGPVECNKLVYFATRELAQDAIDEYQKSKDKKQFVYSYPMAGLTADCILLRKNRDNEIFVLLIKRGGEPYRDRLAIPGGFLNTETETLKEACIREIQEEVSVKLFASQVVFFRMADKIDRDPRGRTISAIFSAILDDKQVKQVCAGDDAAGFAWIPFTKDVISNLNLAFDHTDILSDFLQSYSNKG